MEGKACLQPRHLEYALNCLGGKVFDWVWYRDLSGFRRVFEVVMIPSGAYEKPSVLLDDRDDLTAAVTLSHYPHLPSTDQ